MFSPLKRTWWSFGLLFISLIASLWLRNQETTLAAETFQVPVMYPVLSVITAFATGASFSWIVLVWLDSQFSPDGRTGLVISLVLSSFLISLLPGNWQGTPVIAQILGPANSRPPVGVPLSVMNPWVWYLLGAALAVGTIRKPPNK